MNGPLRARADDLLCSSGVHFSDGNSTYYAYEHHRCELLKLGENVPAVLVLTGFVQHLRRATRAWLKLAISSTLAGAPAPFRETTS
jgi:hypothetical protein